MRAAAAPPNAGPVTRFMLYEREFPDSVAASVQSLDGALERVEADPQDSPPVLRVRRMLADLELERLDAEIHERYFEATSLVSRGSGGVSPRPGSA